MFAKELANQIYKVALALGDYLKVKAHVCNLHATMLQTVLRVYMQGSHLGSQSQAADVKSTINGHG